MDGLLRRQSLRTKKKPEARRRERELIKQAEAGILASEGPKRLLAATTEYLAYKKTRNSPRTVELESELLKPVTKYFGDIRLTNINPTAIRRFQVHRRGQVAVRTTNMTVSALIRVLKFSGRWRVIEAGVDGIHPIKEPESDVGRALTVEELDRLLEVASSKREWEHIYCAAVLASETSMCSVEVRNLRRRDVEVGKEVATVSRGKNDNRRREIPLLPGSMNVVKRMLARLDALGSTSSDHYLWCACKWNRFDPSRPQTSWGAAWRSLVKRAGLPRLRFHDLRHTVVTDLGETAAGGATTQAIAGQTSAKMVRRYSHIRREAKRNALEAVAAYRERQRQEARTKRASENPPPPPSSSALS